MHNHNQAILIYIIYFLISVVISLILKSIHRIIIIQQTIYLIKNQLIISQILQILLDLLEVAINFN